MRCRWRKSCSTAEKRERQDGRRIGPINARGSGPTAAPSPRGSSATLRAQGDRMPDTTWTGDDRLELRGAKFIATAVPMGDIDERLVIVKTPEMVRRYLDLVDLEKPRRIFELGINTGGSTALLALAGEPELVLAIDLAASKPAALERVTKTHELEGILVTRFGLDQSDRAALTGFVDEHLRDATLDLVIDDASHILQPTRVSFEVLFPRLRTDGIFIIEDWSSEVFTANVLSRVLPEGVDAAERLPVVNQLIHHLNSRAELPEDVRANLAATASASEWVLRAIFASSTND